MTIFAIGDVQGCYDSLMKLLDKLDYDMQKDELWFAGDIVNRGPSSLKSLRFIKSLGNRAVTVLGNHDLHLLSAYFSPRLRQNNRDTLDQILRAKDCDELLDWLLHRPLMHYEKSINTAMVHAGLPPQWSIKNALRQAGKLERILQGDEAKKLFKRMYAEPPRKWSSLLTDWEKRQYALAVFTRIRYIYPKGALEMSQKGAPGSQKLSTIPWFDAKNARWQDQARIVFGHWSTLGDTQRNDVICLDGGCVWGGHLIAARLTSKTKVRYTKVNCGA